MSIGILRLSERCYISESKLYFKSLLCAVNDIDDYIKFNSTPPFILPVQRYMLCGVKLIYL